MRAWQIDWRAPATRALMEMHPDDAMKVDAAVIAFAHAGTGSVSSVADDPRGLWLRAAGYVIRLQMYPDVRTVSVRWLFNPGSRR